MSADEIVLDISRLLSRVRHYTPSGVDRVEMAYARGLIEQYKTRLKFAAVHPFGGYGRIPRDKALSFLDRMELRWAREEGRAKPRSILEILPTLFDLMPTKKKSGGRTVYVQASPHHLDNSGLVKNILAREKARFLCLVHDLIPLEYPEYARPAGAAQHRARIETITQYADSIIVYSNATRRSLQPWLTASGRNIDIHHAMLGAQDILSRESESRGGVYFLCVGTIEPRKNHLLLLQLWRNLAQTRPAGTIPNLVVVGRRGWENEQILDMLDRCPAMKTHVDELNGCPDRKLHSLIRGARALLMPSFVEGFGLPIIESLSIGTPVICSDIPAHREAGGAAPDFLDPLDGPAWQARILDYYRAGPAYAAQMARIDGWRQPTWSDHIRIVCDAIEVLRHTA